MNDLNTITEHLRNALLHRIAEREISTPKEASIEASIEASSTIEELLTDISADLMYEVEDICDTNVWHDAFPSKVQD